MKKVPLNLIIFIVLYSIMFCATTYMIIWQQTQGFIVVNQILLLIFALICLVADIASIRQVLLIKKGKVKKKINE